MVTIFVALEFLLSTDMLFVKIWKIQGGKASEDTYSSFRSVYCFINEYVYTNMYFYSKILYIWVRCLIICIVKFSLWRCKAYHIHVLFCNHSTFVK